MGAHGEAPVRRVARLARKLLLDTEKGVVLGDTLGTRGRTSLDLAGAEGNDEVGDDGVLGLTATVRDHDSPSVGLGELGTRQIRTHVSQEIQVR